MPAGGTTGISEKAPVLLGVVLAARLHEVIHAAFIGDRIPVEGVAFPQFGASVIEFQRTPVLNAVCERGHGAPQYPRTDAKTTMRREDLEVNAGTGTQLAWTFDQRTAGAEIDERHRVPRPQDGLRPGYRRLPEAPIDAPVG